MAKFEFIHPKSEKFPEFTQTVEVRVWSTGGTSEQPFYIGSGINMQADCNLWLEISYSVEGAQVFYTRNFLHQFTDTSSFAAEAEKRLDEIVEKGEGEFRFGDMLPETSLTLTLAKYIYPDENDQEIEYTHSTFKISCDVGTVFGRSGPGMTSIDIDLKSIEPEEGIRFVRDLIHEMDAVWQGKHPDPAAFPAGSSEWPLIEQLNRQAYNKISDGYREDYFTNPLLVKAFDGWLARLPQGGHILDAGCGHGYPVIGRMLEKGFQVTGSDFSPEMLRLAGQQFPQAAYKQTTTTMITDQNEYDGICSFNSVLYLDPIDLLNSIYRLHLALKPGGLLFLYALDTGPDWRGEPFGDTLNHWMWSWHYGMDEAAGLVAEHEYFKVLDAQKVKVDKKDEKRIAQELKKQQREEEKFRQKQARNPSPIPLPFFKIPIERAPYAYVVIAQRSDK